MFGNNCIGDGCINFRFVMGALGYCGHFESLTGHVKKEEQKERRSEK